jgi:hypothetical protein
LADSYIEMLLPKEVVVPSWLRILNSYMRRLMTRTSQ